MRGRANMLKENAKKRRCACSTCKEVGGVCVRWAVCVRGWNDEGNGETRTLAQQRRLTIKKGPTPSRLGESVHFGMQICGRDRVGGGCDCAACVRATADCSRRRRGPYGNRRAGKVMKNDTARLRVVYYVRACIHTDVQARSTPYV